METGQISEIFFFPQLWSSQ